MADRLMSPEEKAAKTSAVFSLISAGAATAALLKKAPAGSTVNFPPEFLQTLLGILDAMGVTLADLQDILAAIQAIPGGGSGGSTFQGWPPNADYVSTVLIQCQVAMQAYPVPGTIVPDDFEVLVKAYPTNAIGSLVYVATNPAPNVNSAYPLVPNEAYRLKIKDTGKIYLFTNIAGSSATVSVEQRSAG